MARRSRRLVLVLAAGLILVVFVVTAILLSGQVNLVALLVVVAAAAVLLATSVYRQRVARECRRRNGGWELRRGVWVPSTLAAELHRARRRRAGLRLGRSSALGLFIALVLGLGTLTEAVDKTYERARDRCHEFGHCHPPTPTPTPPSYLVGSLTEVRLGAAGIQLATVYYDGGVEVPVGMPEVWLAWPGRLVTYRIELAGRGDGFCDVQWTLYDAATGKRFRDNVFGWRTEHAETVPITGWSVVTVQEEAAVGWFWVPYVAPGTFVVEVELACAVGPVPNREDLIPDEDQIVLDLERTESFEVGEGDLAVPKGDLPTPTVTPPSAGGDSVDRTCSVRPCPFP